jgi:hypothetical protein
MWKHNAIKCVTTKATKQDVIVFDWFRGRPAGEDPLNFDVVFPSTLNTYPDNRAETSYNDCGASPSSWMPDYKTMDDRIRKAQDSAKNL